MKKISVRDYSARTNTPINKIYQQIERGNLKTEFIAGDRFIIINPDIDARGHKDYKKLIDATGLKYWRVAELLGVSYSSLNGYLNGAQRIPRWVKARMNDIIKKANTL